MVLLSTVITVLYCIFFICYGFAGCIFVYVVKKLFLCSWISCVDESRLSTVDKVSETG